MVSDVRDRIRGQIQNSGGTMQRIASGTCTPFPIRFKHPLPLCSRGIPMIARLLVLAMGVHAVCAWAGCSASIGDVSAPDPAASEKLLKQVPTYEDAQLSHADNYIRAGSIDASMCFRALGDSSDDAVIMLLRQKAHDMGANGITDVSCGRGPVMGFRCLAARACSATALRIVSPDDATN